MWTDYSVMGKFETGRVYVVYQDKNVSSEKILGGTNLVTLSLLGLTKGESQ